MSVRVGHDRDDRIHPETQWHAREEMSVFVDFNRLVVDLDGIARVRITRHDQFRTAHGDSLRRQLQYEIRYWLDGEYRCAVVVCLDDHHDIGVTHKALRISRTEHERISSRR